MGHHEQEREPAEREDVRVGGTRCPYCHDSVQPVASSSRVCNRCLARHHTECWIELGSCGSCGSEESLSPTSPEELSPAAPTREAPQLQLPDWLLSEQRAGESLGLGVAATIASAIGVLPFWLAGSTNDAFFMVPLCCGALASLITAARTRTPLRGALTGLGVGLVPALVLGLSLLLGQPTADSSSLAFPLAVVGAAALVGVFLGFWLRSRSPAEAGEDPKAELGEDPKA